MPRTLINLNFPNLPRLAQDNSFYCGPASLQMLFAFLGKKVTQEEIVQAAGIVQKIKEHGMTVGEIGEAARKMAPELQFWWKYYASISELSQLVNLYKYPVGIVWQGIFDYPDEEVLEDEDEDAGHIAVITQINTQKNIVFMADPDLHYAGRDRYFTILQFERRWWDIDSVLNPLTGKAHEEDVYHALFLITPQVINFPESLGLKRF